MTRANILAVIIAVVFFAGCAVIPTGEFRQSESRKKIEKEELTFIQVDSTQKQEILLKLGEPNMTWGEERQFMYWMGTHQGIWFACGGGYGGAGCVGGPVVNYLYLLLIEFDEHNVVKRHELDTRTYFDPIASPGASLPMIHKKLAEWSQAEQVRKE